MAHENREGRVRIDCPCIANDAKMRVVDVAQSLRPRGRGKRAGGEIEEARWAAFPWRGDGLGRVIITKYFSAYHDLACRVPRAPTNTQLGHQQAIYGGNQVIADEA